MNALPIYFSGSNDSALKKLQPPNIENKAKEIFEEMCSWDYSLN